MFQNKISVSPHRTVIFRRYHDFGPGVGEHVVELSLCKKKFYIIVVEQTPRNKPKPHVVEIFISQAKKLFNYCGKNYT